MQTIPINIVRSINMRCRLFVLVIALATLVVGCSGAHDSDNQQTVAVTNFVYHRVPLDHATVVIPLPKEYIPVTKELLVTNSFYFRDTPRNPFDPLYFNSDEHRAFVSIKQFDHTGEPYMSFSEDSLFNFLLHERFLTHKDYSPKMPLVEKFIDKQGHPYAYIIHATRYDSSYSCWQNHPNTDICPIGADSVECDFYYYTVRGCVEYIIRNYSLVSFESFSFTEKRNVLEGIEIIDKKQNGESGNK